MKQVFMGTALLMVTALFSNASAQQVDEETQVKGAIALMEATHIVKEMTKVVDLCGVLGSMNLLTQMCVDFFVDYRDSVKGVLDRYNNYEINASNNIPPPITKIPDINSTLNIY